VELTLNDLLTVTGLAVVVNVVVQLAKGLIEERWTPLFAVGVGVAVAVLATAALGQYGVQAVGQALLTGLLAGATAVGLYKLQNGTVLKPKE
jgi:hypothetical protein